MRTGVKEGSACDLFLSRTLEHATVVRGNEGVDVVRHQGLEVAAGIRQPIAEFVSGHPELRLLEGPFMEIRQALGTTRTRHPDTVGFLRAFIEELTADRFVADALGARTGAAQPSHRLASRSPADRSVSPATFGA